MDAHLRNAALGEIVDRITIIGLRPIGVSIALGLKRARLADTEVVGTDGDRESLSRASKMGAVDRTAGNLKSALEGAHLVVLDIPLADTREMLEAIGPILEEGCVVTDTDTAKVQVMEWAESHLSPGSSFVGGRPLPKRSVTSVDDADAALFDDTDYCVIPAKSASPDSVKTVVGMVEMLGAKPMFLDAHEHDSYAAAMAQLPVILSAALVNSASGSPSWREMHRLAGPEFRGISQLAANDPEDSSAGSLATSDALVHWINQMTAELNRFSDLIKAGDGLLDTFVHAWEEHARWEAGAVAEEPGFDVPSPGKTVASSLFGKRLTDRYQQLTGAKRQHQ